MIFTERMVHLSAVVLERDSDLATRVLLDEGVLDFVDLHHLPGAWHERITSVRPRVAATSYSELRKRIETILAQADLAVDAQSKLTVERLSPISVAETKQFLDSTNVELQAIRDEQKKTQEEIDRLNEIERQLTLFGDLGSTIQAQSRYSFLNIQAGSIPANQLGALQSSLEGFPQVLISYESERETGDEERIAVLLISLRRDTSTISQVVARFGWSEIDLSASQNQDDGGERVLKEVHSKVERLRDRQVELRASLVAKIKDNKEELESLWANLRLNELYSVVQSNYGRTETTLLFSGWLPESKRSSLERRLQTEIGNRCYMEWSSPGEITRETRSLPVPVRLKNPKAFAPFQMLVENYAVPEYGTIDPTPLVVVAYLIMFGLMFADAGHGLVLILSGLLGMIAFRKRKKTGLFNLSALVVWCGASAIVAGVLVGSYFGMRWFDPVWMDLDALVLGRSPTVGIVTSIFGVLKITIVFGITVIGIGLLLNWINLIGKRRWYRLFFDLGGLIGGGMYAGGVWVAWFYVSHQYREFPNATLLLLLLGAPALLMAIKPLVELKTEMREHKKQFGAFTIVDFLMGWVVELLELFTRYLSNTLSFMRVAGLGIAHVSLMIAFFDIARLAGGGGFNLWSLLVLLFGNLLVIVLEGLSAGIQALRLNYYEFFSKFFSGTGRAYAPISLRSND